ncbi:MAG TPA: hypothetical protein DHW39_04150 [Erysipelotrichaceae bacterium]|nr:hypothetical protein [Erysipelotrichaceae bacterium]
MNDRWKHLFRPVILERGRDIFESGEIDEVEKTAEGWRGIAHGTYDYEVETYIEGEEVTGMSCTCPYAEGGNHCKHMAALLYAVSEEVINPVSVSEDLNDVLEKMNEIQLRKELKEILLNDSSLKNRILQKYRSAPADMADVNRILSLLGNLSVRIGGRNEYISWEKGWEYVQAFQEILTDSVEPMIERNETMQAFAVLKGAFHILNDVDMDGSGGEHSEIASSIEEYWDRVIHLASKEERTQMYQWFRAMEKRSDDLICGDSITSALENYFDDPEYLLPMLKDMRNKLRGDQADNYMLEYDLEKYKNLLIRSGSDLSEYETWLENHNDLKSVKRILLKEAEGRGDSLQAIAILREMYEQEKIAGLKRSYLEQLLEKYRETGNTEKVKEALWKLLAQYRISSMAYVRELRSLCDSAEWKNARETILAVNESLKPDVYDDEEMYDSLMEYLMHQPVEMMDRYRMKLKDLYPDALSTYYAKYLDRISCRYGNLALYRTMRTYLNILAGIPGGISKANVLIDSWMERYPTRKAMQEMLREVKAEYNSLP